MAKLFFKNGAVFDKRGRRPRHRTTDYLKTLSRPTAPANPFQRGPLPRQAGGIATTAFPAGVVPSNTGTCEPTKKAATLTLGDRVREWPRASSVSPGATLAGPVRGGGGANWTRYDP